MKKPGVPEKVTQNTANSGAGIDGRGCLMPDPLITKLNEIISCVEWLMKHGSESFFVANADTVDEMQERIAGLEDRLRSLEWRQHSHDPIPDDMIHKLRKMFDECTSVKIKGSAMDGIDDKPQEREYCCVPFAAQVGHTIHQMRDVWGIGINPIHIRKIDKCPFCETEL